MSLVCHIIASLEDGGAQASLVRLCTRSTKFSHAVISFVSGGKHLQPLQAAGIPVATLDVQRGRFGLAALRQLYRLLKAARPDVVQTWMYHADLIGGVVARAAGIPAVIWNVRHSELDAGKRTTRLAMRACAHVSKRIPAKIVTCASRAAEVHGHAGYDLQRFVVIPNGYDFEEFTIDEAARKCFRRSIGIGEATPLVGAVGRWAPQKDHETFLAALAQARYRRRDLIAVIAGTGCDPQNSALTRLIASYGLHGAVHLLGPRSDVPSIMNGLDLLVLSASHGEAFPNVVAEAMACGTPCAVTDVGDAAMIVGDAGWVVPPRNPVALGNAIHTALQCGARTPDSRRRIRAAVTSRFPLGRMVDAYETLWRTTLTTAGACHAR